LCLAAYRTLPALNVGFGFIVPPTDGDAFPPLLPGKPPFADAERLLRAIQSVQRARGRPVPETLTGAFADAEPFLTVLPELDHYARVRREGHVGPLVELLPPQPWPEPPRFFAYLKATNPATGVILAALARSGFPGQAYVLGAKPEDRARLARPGVEILDAPPALNEVLKWARVVVHHGGINVAQQALAAGRPQLVFPEHLEALLTAVQLHRLGVAHYMKDEFPQGTIVAGIRQLMTQAGFRDRARQLADEVHARGPWNPLPRILARCCELLNGPRR
jgi:UDP:flavonoid glycosyltransferase YjiC (YdhE family)